MSLKSKIQALITAANAKTGETDATLTDAVQTLVDGYGQGGAPVIQPLSITENGTYTAPEGVDGYSPVMVNVQGGGRSQIITLTQDYSGAGFYTLRSLISEATGYISFSMVNNKTPTEMGYWLQNAICITNEYGSIDLVCRRTSSGTVIQWSVTAGSWSSMAGSEFTVYDLGGMV